MDWADVGNAVKKVAPLLGTVLGGPAAGGAVSLICNMLGKSDQDATPEDILQAINVDPKITIELRKIEAENKAELQKLVLESERIYLADRQSARGREIEIARATGGKDINLYILAWTVILGFFALVVVLMLVELPAGAEGYINQLFGAIATGFGMVLAYFFGSSKGSADKTKLMTSIAVPTDKTNDMK